MLETYSKHVPSVREGYILAILIYTPFFDTITRFDILVESKGGKVF